MWLQANGLRQLLQAVLLKNGYPRVTDPKFSRFSMHVASG
jgi:hypothetical protein